MVMMLSWNVTNQCNMFCRHCYRDAGTRAGEELDTKEGKELIHQARQAGFRMMIFSGGEPLLRPDLLELLATAVEVGIRPVLGTNGSLLTPDLAQELKTTGVGAVGISLDSTDPQKEDGFRQLPGAYQGALSAMEACRQVGLPFQVHTTVMDWNADEVVPLTDLAVQMGARGHHLFFLVPTGRAVEIEQESLRAEGYEAKLRQILNKQRQVDIELKPTCAPQFVRIAKQMGVATRFRKGCLAGISYCIVNPVGKVQPCAYLDLECGNVREQPFGSIWRESPVFLRLRSQVYSGWCGECAYRDACGGCRARAYYYHGDYMAQEPWCLYRGGRGYNPRGEVAASE